jgi:hypothetical protein
MQASCVLSPQARTLSLGEACSKARARPLETDARTHMLLAKPIAPTILRLAVPNSTVMMVQILIGLLEVYFVSRTGVDALAGVSPVFPLVSLVVAIAQGALGGGIVTTVARVLGAGRIGDASEYAWYAVVLGVPLGLATTAVMVALGPTLYAHMGVSGNALEIAVSYSFIIFAGATVIWLFNLLMAVVRGTGNLQVPVIVVCGGALILVPLSPVLILGPLAIKGSVLRAAPSRCLCITGWERWPTQPICGAGLASSSRHFVCQDFRWRPGSPFSVSAECRPSYRPPPI